METWHRIILAGWAISLVVGLASLVFPFWKRRDGALDVEDLFKNVRIQIVVAVTVWLGRDGWWQLAPSFVLVVATLSTFFFLYEDVQDWSAQKKQRAKEHEDFKVWWADHAHDAPPPARPE